MKLLKYKIIRIFLYLMFWIMISQIIFIFIQPKFTKPTEYFNICAEKIIQDDTPLPLYSIQEYQKNPNHFQLCTQPIEKYGENGYFSLQLIQNSDQSYLLKTWNDSMSDPMEYHYRINDNHIEPIAWRFGTNMAMLISHFYGLIIGLIVYAILKRRFYQLLDK